MEYKPFEYVEDLSDDITAKIKKAVSKINGDLEGAIIYNHDGSEVFFADLRETWTQGLNLDGMGRAVSTAQVIVDEGDMGEEEHLCPECACSEQAVSVEDVGCCFQDPLAGKPPTPVDMLWLDAYKQRYFLHNQPLWEGGSHILDLQDGQDWTAVMEWYQEGRPKVAVSVPMKIYKTSRHYFTLDLDTNTAILHNSEDDLAQQCWKYIPHTDENVERLGVGKW